MNFVKRFGKHLPLSLLVVFLPLVLLLIAAAVDYVYDRSYFPDVLVRFLPIHIVLLVLLLQTLRGARNETLESVEQSLSDSKKWFIVACSISLSLVLVMFWPISNWSTQLFGGNGDGYNWRWQIWRMSQEFRRLHIFPTRFDDVIAPYGVDLRLNDGYLSMYIGGLWNLITGPTLAYNMTLATSVILNFFSARKLSLTVSSSQVVGIIAGITMATAPSITLRQMGHLNLCFSFVMCLAAIEGIKLIGNSKVRVWQPTLVLILSFFSSFYFFVLSAIFYTSCVLIHLVKNFGALKPSLSSSIVRLTSVALITGIIISPFIWTRLHHDNAERIAGAPASSARTDEYMFYSADPRTFFLPPSDARIQLPQTLEARKNTSPNTVENTPFPGYVSLIAVALVIIFVRKWRWVIASLWSLFTILALGPSLIWGADSQLNFFFPNAVVESKNFQPVSWLPYADVTTIPGFSALRTPNRFAMILPVISVIALAALANEFFRRLRTGRVISCCISIIVLLIIPSFRNSNYWYDTSFSVQVERALKVIREDKSDSRVFVAGQNCLQTIFMANLQVEHRHPIVGCQTFSAAVPWYSGLALYRNSSAIAAVQCDPTTFGLSPMNSITEIGSPTEILKELKTVLDIGYIVFPKEFECADLTRTREIIDILRTSPEVLADTTDFLIIRT